MGGGDGSPHWATGVKPRQTSGRKNLRSLSIFITDKLNFEANCKEIKKMKKIIYKQFAM